MKKTPLTSREYKVMLDAKKFENVDEGAAQFWSDLCYFAYGNSREAAAATPLQLVDEREIAFLDTPDLELLVQHGHVLRRRQKIGDDKTQYTLKVRSVDRYVAAGAEVAAVEKLSQKQKLEEDLVLLSRGPGRALLQHSRFSHSCTAEVKMGRATPDDVAAAARWFPGLKQLAWSEKKRKEIPLVVVNDFQAHERIYRGAEMVFGEKKEEQVEAEVALLIWTDGQAGPVTAAEFSFRYQDRRERYPAAAAKMAKDFFEALGQLSAWVRPDVATKTAIAYGARSK
ncbi:MAG: hypothetical protein ACIALR_07200 [Blastopirellula sp. JB062]